MKVVVVSDVHDNLWALEKVLEAIGREGAQTLLFCGDLCAPFSLRALAEGFSGPVHVVFGNSDDDKMGLTRMADAVGNVTLHGILAEVPLDGVRAAMTHYPPIGRRLATSGQFQAVFYGHSHVAEISESDGCLSLNPGEVMGRYGRITYATYDTESGLAEIKEI